MLNKRVVNDSFVEIMLIIANYCWNKTGESDWLYFNTRALDDKQQYSIIFTLMYSPFVL